MNGSVAIFIAFFLAGLAVELCFGFWAMYIGQRKGISGPGAFVLGTFAGLLGVAIIALLSPRPDSTPTRPPRAAPWLVAATLGLLVASLAVILVHVGVVRTNDTRTVGLRTGPTPAQLTAVEAGATEAANITTFNRTTFEKNFARALNGATGNLKKDLADQKANTLSAMTKGKFDLKASVIEAAFESEAGGKVLVLVTLNGKHVFDSGQSDVAAPQRLELTMVRNGDTWLASNLSSVGIQ